LCFIFFFELKRKKGRERREEFLLCFYFNVTEERKKVGNGEIGFLRGRVGV